MTTTPIVNSSSNTAAEELPSLGELFAAADRVADHRSPAEQTQAQQQWQAAVAELAEAIGYSEVEA